ncbi:hypothetical protein P153DRAFT_283324 [Dothidotthia symphoricarpi CBS 119687]|uniref:Uncharacterized protein n=1 Tax=Dothidotthia symphoricarpi CBS 119687 TaxID=1392245 RepID=A0A6A6AP56_9PLEO|nr:uncharacterized protein P153DRAFT_283324 [Dothidotthia symphoricarpi CBS 119687]KAF2132928.1 hypothetical protein P153DRAFT_283324 [Dothidotthia symphoricarpi CBS 119687]
MSLVRGLTKRVKRAGSDASKQTASTPARNQSVKFPKLQIDRSKISSPLALVSTTNMLSYNAPDIATMGQTMPSVTTAAATHSSGDDSDHSVSTRSRASSHSSRDTLTDASSVESSPTSPAPNHLSNYFGETGKQVRRTASTTSIGARQVHVQEERPATAAPEIPQRALSHSKRAHERLAHKRSLQNLSRSSPGSQRQSYDQRSSVDMFSATIQEEDHPFGRELEQLNEVVEEFGGVVRDAEMEEDLTAMRRRDLANFCASEYLAEIQPLCSVRFGAAPMAWI